MKILAALFIVCLLACPAQAGKRARVSLPAARPLTFDAIVDASRAHDVPLASLLGILATENGRLGEALGNKNGTWDLGPFQVNTCHLNDLSEIGYTPEAIMTDGRVNAFAAAWLLQQEIKRSGSLWHGVGHYHSRTPFRKYGYIRKVRKNMEQIRRDGLKSLPIHWEKKL
ncbi:MAG: lytic transglycosylase domain-containing protein [Desulfovibrio sp.]